VSAGIPCLTTVQAAAAAVQGIEELIRGDVGVRSLQDLHAQFASWRSGAQLDATSPAVHRIEDGR
jgi:carbamoyl-phosphate synthase large subunit